MGRGQGQDSQCSGRGAVETARPQNVLEDYITGMGTLITMGAVLETVVLRSTALATQLPGVLPNAILSNVNSPKGNTKFLCF